MEKNTQERIMLHMLIDKALDVMELTPHYVRINMSNYGNLIEINVRENGFDSEEDYALTEGFYAGKILDSKRFKRTIHYLDSLMDKSKEGQSENEISV